MDLTETGFAFSDPAVAELAILAAALGAVMEYEGVPLPPDLSPMSDEELAEARKALAAEAKELRGLDAHTEESVSRLEAIGADVARIDAVVLERRQAAEDLQARVDAAMSGIDEPDPSTEDPLDEPDPDPVELVEGGTDPDPAEGARRRDAGDPVPVANAIAEALVTALQALAEPGDEPGDDDALEPAAFGAPARTRPRLPIRGPGALTKRRPAAAVPVPRSEPMMRTTAAAFNTAPGTPLEDPLAAALAIIDVKNNWMRRGNVPPGSTEYVTICSGVKENFTHKIADNDLEGTFEVFHDIRRELDGADDGHGNHGTWQALVAAGGGRCAPNTPLYDFFRTAVPQNPYDASLPVVNSPRGGIKYIVPPSYTQAFSAVGSFDNNATTPPDKPCLHVTCPTTNEEWVTAITQCVEFDNLQYRVFPELVAAFMQDVAVNFTQAKEVKFLNYLHSKATAVTQHDYGMGASLNLLYDLTVTAERYRKRAQMTRGQMLTFVAPDWTIDVFKMDLALRGFGGDDWFDMSDAQVDAIIRSRGLDPVWINDSPTAFTAENLRGAQTASTMLDWPAQVHWWLYAPGTVVKLDSGTLDLGLVRDSVLNKQNNLQIFMEEWNGMAVLGQEILEINTKICVNGAAAATKTPVVCP